MIGSTARVLLYEQTTEKRPAMLVGPPVAAAGRAASAGAGAAKTARAIAVERRNTVTTSGVGCVAGPATPRKRGFGVGGVRTLQAATTTRKAADQS